MNTVESPLAIIGLGNPGVQYARTRHNIGFLIVDALAETWGGSWQEKGDMEYTKVSVNGTSVILIKPLTYMNDSGRVIPFLKKQGINPEDTLIVHDELEKPFGSIALRLGGSARGHNGLRSIIGAWGENFWRLRFGISRPTNKADVGTYVLQNFSEPISELDAIIAKSVDTIKALYS